MRHPSRSNPANRVSDPWPSRRIWLRRALVTYVIGLLLAVTLPIGHLIDISLIRLYQLGRLVGVPNGVSPAWYEFLLNVALFAVPTAMAAVLWPAVRPWIWVFAACGGSIAIEIVQYLVLPRVADPRDVVANTLGAAVGLGAIRLRDSRDRKPLSCQGTRRDSACVVGRCTP